MAIMTLPLFNRKLSYSFIQFLIIFYLIFSFTMCSSEDIVKEINFDANLEEDITFSLAQKQISINAQSQILQFPLTSKLSWKATSSASWCSLNNSEGSTGHASIYVRITNNNEVSERKCILTFILDGINPNPTLEITQLGSSPALALSVANRTVAALDSIVNSAVSITSNRPWSASISSEASTWCFISQREGQDSNVLPLDIRLSQNVNSNSRNCVVSFTVAGLAPAVFTLTQLGTNAVIIPEGQPLPVLNTINGIVQEVVSNGNRVVVSSTTTSNNDITITSNINWVATIQGEGDLSWISTSPTNQTNTETSNIRLEILFTQNTSITTRYATIVISGTRSDNQVVTQEIAVSQFGTDPNITFTANQIDVLANITNAQTNILSNVNWTATTNSSWCTLPISNGVSNTNRVPLGVTLTENTGITTRNCLITVTNGTVSREFRVTQLGSNPDIELSIEPNIVNISATTTLVSNIVITSNHNWTANTNNSSWCLLENTNRSGSPGSTTIRVNILPNNKVEPRSCSITISVTGISGEPFIINQSGVALLPNLTVSASNIILDAASINTLSNVISVTSNVNWSATSTNNCAVSPSSSTLLNTNITVSNFTENNTANSRTVCTITFVGSYNHTTVTRVLTIQQFGVTPTILLNNNVNLTQSIAYYSRSSINFQVVANGRWSAVAQINNTSTLLCSVSSNSGNIGITNNININFTNTNLPIGGVSSARTCVVTFTILDNNGVAIGNSATYSLTQNAKTPTITLLANSKQSYQNLDLSENPPAFLDGVTVPLQASMSDTLTLRFISDTDWTAVSDRPSWCIVNTPTTGTGSINENGIAIDGSISRTMNITLNSNLQSVWNRICNITVSATGAVSRTLTITQAGIGLSVRDFTSVQAQVPNLSLLATVHKSLNGSTIVSHSTTEKRLRLQASESWSSEILSGNTLNCSLDRTSDIDTTGRFIVISFSTNTTSASRICTIRFKQHSEINNQGVILGTVDYKITQLVQ